MEKYKESETDKEIDRHIHTQTHTKTNKYIYIPQNNNPMLCPLQFWPCRQS